MPPPEPLASRIEVMWRYDGQEIGAHRETVLPNGRLQMMINLASGKGGICGIHSHHTVVDTASIRKRPVNRTFRRGPTSGIMSG